MGIGVVVDWGIGLVVVGEIVVEGRLVGADVVGKAVGEKMGGIVTVGLFVGDIVGAEMGSLVSPLVVG